MCYRTVLEMTQKKYCPEVAYKHVGESAGDRGSVWEECCRRALDVRVAQMFCREVLERGVRKSVARESVGRCCRAWDRSLKEPCCGDVAECCEEALQNVAEKPWRWL